MKSLFKHCLASALCVAALYAILIVLSECVGFFLEVLVFTVMGVIVNAGTLLKFAALVIMLIFYSYDCFNNVEKKYLKLNRALFAEVTEWFKIDRSFLRRTSGSGSLCSSNLYKLNRRSWPKVKTFCQLR